MWEVNCEHWVCNTLDVIPPLLSFMERIHFGNPCILCTVFILSPSLFVFLDLFASFTGTVEAEVPLLWSIKGACFDVSNRVAIRNPDFSTVMKCRSSTPLRAYFVVQFCFLSLTHNIRLYHAEWHRSCLAERGPVLDWSVWCSYRHKSCSFTEDQVSEFMVCGYHSCIGRVGRLGWQVVVGMCKHSCDHVRRHSPIHEFFCLAPALT